MVRLRILNDRIIHKCVQCGSAVQYPLSNPIACEHCHAAQRLTNTGRKASIPFDFISDTAYYWRVWYHTEETNCTQTCHT